MAIAFPRNTIQLPHQANDMQRLAQGRFTLGLGTQVRAQIEKRYGAAFDRPVARMKELVGALRAVFAPWNTGERLDFRGEYYRHTLMTPTFNPGPNPFGPPPIYLAAAGRDAVDFEVVPEIIVSVGEDHSAARRLLEFYGSTPAYRPVLDVHGWGDLQPEVNALAKQGRWEAMAGS